MSIDLDALIDLELATPRYRRRSALLNELFLNNHHEPETTSRQAHG